MLRLIKVCLIDVFLEVFWTPLQLCITEEAQSGFGKAGKFTLGLGCFVGLAEERVDVEEEGAAQGSVGLEKRK